MANRYWIGNGGNWNDTAHWSESSGGTGGASEPTGNDDVYFDANSFNLDGQVVNLKNGAGNNISYCRNFDWRGVTHNPALNFTGLLYASRSDLYIYGSMFLVSGMSITDSTAVGFNSIFLLAVFEEVLSTGNLDIPVAIYIEGEGSIWHQNGDLKMKEGSFNIGKYNQLGRPVVTYNTENYAITMSGHHLNIYQNGKLNLGSSILTINGTSLYDVIDIWEGGIFDMGSSTVNIVYENQPENNDYMEMLFEDGSVVIGGTSTINITGTTPDGVYIENENEEAVSLYNLNVSGKFWLGGNFNFESVVLNPGSESLWYPMGPDPMYVNTNRFSAIGTLANPIYLVDEQYDYNNPPDPAVVINLIVPSGTVAARYAYIRANTASGGANFYAFDSHDLGDNSGWLWYAPGPAYIKEGDPFSTGIYTLGRYSKNYPSILDLTYPISEDTLEGVEVGAVLVVGNDFYVSWKRVVDGVETYGIDKIDYSAKYTGAYLETRVITGNRDEFGSFRKFLFGYSDLPTGTNFTFKISKDYGENWLTLNTRQDSKRKIIYSDDGMESTVLQLRIQATVNGNQTPSLEEGKVIVE